MNRQTRRNLKIRGGVLAILLAGSFAQAATLTGTYATSSGFTLQVTSLGTTTVGLKLSGSYRDNTCVIETGKLQLNRRLVTYQPSDDPSCRVQVRFRGTQALVNQSGVCGCGLNVNLSGTYQKRSTAPK
jgi:hypothetical protein